MKRFLSAILALGLLLCCGCTTKAQTATQIHFDTAVTITLYGADSSLLADCFALCRRYEGLLSRTVESSDIARLNAEGGATVDWDTAQLLTKALEYSEQSGGAFDVTICPVRALWDFTGTKQLPNQALLQAELQKVGYGNLTVNGTQATLKNGAQVDLGGIAKGFIADRLAQLIQSRGATGAVLNLGGNVLVLGQENHKKYFTVGIKKPYTQSGETVAAVQVPGGTSVVTSGCYERYFEQEGTVYHHILDPKTGYPVQNNLDGVTIICASSTAADALSTACYVLGEQAGMQLIESIPNTEAVFVTKSGQVLTTGGLKQNKKGIYVFE